MEMVIIGRSPFSFPLSPITDSFINKAKKVFGGILFPRVLWPQLTDDVVTCGGYEGARRKSERRMY